MAHGFLTPQAVTGEGLGIPYKKLFDGLKKLFRKDLRVVNANIKEVRDLLEGKEQKALPPAASKMLTGNQPKGLLPGSSSAIVARKGGIVNTQAKTDIVGRNATNIDKKEQRYLGTTDPDVAGGPKTRKGGTFTDFGSTAEAKPLNNTNFFSKAVNEGVDANTGEYLSREARIAAFQKGKVARNPDQGAPPISPDSGADIVAAVNRNTEAIMRMIDATKAQTSNDSQLAQQQLQAQETLASRAKARAEENALEQGSDLSSFLKATKFKQKEQGGAGGGGGSGDGFDLIGTALDAYDMFGGRRKGRRGGGSRRRPGAARRPPRMQVPKPRGSAPMIPRAKPPAPKGGFRLPGMPKGGMPKGMPKGIGPKGGALSLLFAGMEFGDRKAEGQTNLQAGVGTAASVAGGLAGAKGGAAAGAAIGALFGGVGAVPGALIGGLIGGIGGSMLAGGAADMATGANNPKPFATGGIITKPTQGIVGEAGKEGVFPLEGKRGRDTFLAMGEGILEAQKKGKQEFADLQSLGLKRYFENKGGFKIFGEAFKLVLGPLFGKLAGGIIDKVGNFANGLFGIGGGNPQGGGLQNANMGSDEEDYLMRLMIAEAGGEGELGMAAVARSVMNRAGLIQSGKVGAGTFMADSGSIMDVINAKGQYQPVSEGKLKRALTPEEKARAMKALEMARNSASLRGSLEAEGMSADQINNIMASTGFRTGAAFNDSSQNVNRTKLGNHIFNTAGNTGMLTVGAEFAPSTPQGTGGGAALAAAANSLKGMSTASGPDGGANGCVYAVNKVFNQAGITPPWGQSLYVPTAEEKMIAAGWQQVPYNQMQPGDVFVMKDQKSPPQAHIGVATDNKMILSNSSGKASMSWSATAQGYNAYYGGQGTLYRMPGGQAPATANATPGSPPGSGLSAEQKAQMFQNSGMSALSANALTGASPGPIPASPASPNTGTPIMATSAQVASASTGPAAAPTVINNYYSGGGEQGGTVPNGVSPGIGMQDSGTAIFQDLRIRSLS